MKLNSIKIDRWNFVRNNFALEWFDGTPIGNGDMGALIMPNQQQTKLILAKSDIWDERCDNGKGQRGSFRPFKNFTELKSLIEQQQWDLIDEKFKKALSKWQGRFGLLQAAILNLNTERFEKEIEMMNFTQHLDMSKGVFNSWFETRVRKQITTAFTSVKHEVMAISVNCDLDYTKGKPIRKMTFGMDIGLNILPTDTDAVIQSGLDGKTVWSRVKGYYDKDYTVAFTVEGKGIEIAYDKKNVRLTVTAEKEADFVIYASIISSRDSRNPKAEAIRRVEQAKRTGYKKLKLDHQQWWKKFWATSQIDVPDENILRQYHFGLYLLASSSRKGFPMPGLQGLWATRENGWNDYTNDLNTQMTYWPIYTSNHLELGGPYYDTVHNWLEQARKDTREYYGCRGVQFSCCASQTGIVPYGYLTTMHWAGHAAFVAQNFWTHYRYSNDKEFLQSVAYPVLKECSLFYLDFMKKDERGYYEIWPSNSPEAGEGSYEAWGKNPVIDISLIKMLLNATVKSCSILGIDSDFADQCSEVLSNMPPYPMRDGALIEMESKEFLYSHRHTALITGVYPCSDLQGEVARKTVDRFISKSGKWMWGCHTVTWLASAVARLRRGEQACDLLREFMLVYTAPQGGFNLNYDYHRTGLGIGGPAVFCMESNMGFSAALLDMLLQSHNGVIRVMPALPKEWKQARFGNLRAEGAFLLSAQIKNGKVTVVRIKSEKGGQIFFENPWTRIPQITCGSKKTVYQTKHKILTWDTEIGETYIVNIP